MKRKSFGYRLLCLLLALTLLAGCGAQQPGGEDPSAPTVTEPEQVAQEDVPLRFGIAGDSMVMTDLTPEQRITPALDRAAALDEDAKPYTILVYIVGSNLESQAGCASADIQEMLDSGLDISRCNLIIYTGGSKSWEMDIPSDCNTVWALSGDGTAMEMVAGTEKSVNMGNPAALLDFLCYGYNYYPAEHYGLICWDHGGGPLYGYGNDELYGYDCLTMSEMGDAMAASPFAREKLDFIGFDACLMASLEVADLFSDYADYLIASEETEPGSGWDYSFLSVLNETADPLVLAQRILETYDSSMHSSRWKPEYTLSCMDLSQVPGVMSSMEALYGAMIGDLLDGGYNAIAKSRNETKRFALSAVTGLTDSYDLVDLGSLLDNLSGEYGRHTAPARKAMEEMVVSQVTNLAHVNGVSMYFPYDNKDLFCAGGDLLYNVCMDYDNYETFVKAFTDCWLYGTTDVTWAADQEILSEEDCLTFTLTGEQQRSVATITYTVLEYDPETDTYNPILANMSTAPDENGVVYIPKNPDIFKMHTDMSDPVGENGTIWPMKLAESGQERDVYVSIDNILLTSADIIVGGSQRIQISLANDLVTGQAQIQNVIATSTDAVLFGKQDVDVTHYGCIAYDWEPLYATYDAQGNLLPWNQWSTNGWYYFTFLDFEESFTLERASLRDQEGIFCCQIIMTDIYGQVIGTRLEELYRNTPYRSAQISTPQGVMTFRVYDDHAVVTGFTPIPREISYEYLKLDVTIPDSVEGVPVTVVGDGAFRGCVDLRSVVIPDTVTHIWYDAFGACYYLEEVTLSRNLRYIGNDAFSHTDLTGLELPQGLESICASAFAGTGITTLDLPDSVTYIGPGAFYGCEYLTELNISNDVYRSIDGVLYTADGKTLLVYPGGKWESSYAVPEGVEAIGPAAFRGNLALMHVTFPESLRVIDRLAFCNVTGLQSIDLPEGLEEIGSGAFAVTVAMAPSEAVGSVSIGPNVRWIGREAFAGYRVTAYRVSPDNQWYSDANGCLLNKSGTKLIQAPCGYSGKLTVPDGVSYIEWESLSDCPYITELVIPDSVVSISHAAGIPTNLEKLTVGSGLSDWQNVHRCTEIPQVTISSGNASYTMVDGSIYSHDMTVLYCCRSTEEHFAIPEGVTTISVNAFYGGNSHMRILTLPASLSRITLGCMSNLTGLEEFRVASGNRVFAVYDGLLYSADGRTLYAAPLAKTGTIRVREGTVEIGYRAFYYGGNMQADTIIIPEGVTVIRAGNFSSCPYRIVQNLHLPGSLTDIHPDMLEYVETDEMVIYAPAGSPAEAFALERGFEVLHD